jgi:hypothetical protein
MNKKVQNASNHSIFRKTFFYKQFLDFFIALLNFFASISILDFKIAVLYCAQDTYLSPNFQTFKEPHNRFQGLDSRQTV